MNTIQDLFQQAQLAEAAYSNFTGMKVSTPISEIRRALTTGDGKFSSAQAAAFIKEWRVVNQIPDTTNGFSATVFERLDANQQPTGQYSFSIRGSTQVFADFVADAGIIASAGIANAQVVDMYNYWQRLNTPAGAIYQAAVLVPLAAGEIDQYSASRRIYDADNDMLHGAEGGDYGKADWRIVV